MLKSGTNDRKEEDDCGGDGLVPQMRWMLLDVANCYVYAASFHNEKDAASCKIGMCKDRDVVLVLPPERVVETMRYLIALVLIHTHTHAPISG